MSDVQLRDEVRFIEIFEIDEAPSIDVAHALHL
jgi:hypothetical protein